MRAFQHISAILIGLIFIGCSKTPTDYKPFSDFDFKTGEYRLYGFIHEGGGSDFFNLHKDFYIESISVLDSIKATWVFDSTDKRMPCGWEYELCLVRHDSLVKVLKVNTECSYLISKGWFEFYPDLWNKIPVDKVVHLKREEAINLREQFLNPRNTKNQIISKTNVSKDSFSTPTPTPTPPIPPDFSYMFWDTLIVNYIPNAQIKISHGFDSLFDFELFGDSLLEGEKIVFEYYKIHKEFYITSRDYYERVIFEIDTALRDFNFKDKELVTIKCVMDIGCHDDWWEFQDYSVSNGEISGEKIHNGVWKVKVNINNGRTDSKYLYEVQFEETFTIKKRAGNRITFANRIGG